MFSSELIEFFEGLAATIGIASSAIGLKKNLLNNCQALDKAKISAESASKIKSEFLANMSHELRNSA